jgi:hypothetical protein
LTIDAFKAHRASFCRESQTKEASKKKQEEAQKRKTEK